MTTSELDARIHAYRPDLADINLQGLVAADRYVPGTPARVTMPVAGLFRSPHHDSPLDSQAVRGDQVAIFERGNAGWNWVQIGHDGYVGWMETSALTQESMDPTHRVCAPRTLLFKEPDIKSPLLQILPLGATVAVSGDARDHNADYALVEPEGAIVKQHLCRISDTLDDFVSVAEQLTGTPYLFGGSTAFAIDCSALVQLAMRMAGFAVLRDADMQEATIGTMLRFGSDLPVLQRGDLIFWKGHVGIMQDGEYLLHANVHHMAVASEPLAAAIDRISKAGLDVTSVRRP